MSIDTKVYIDMPDGTEYVAILEGKHHVPLGINEMWIVSRADDVLEHHVGINVRSVLHEGNAKLP